MDNIWSDIKVSYFPHMKSYAAKSLTLQEILNMIRSDMFKERIVELRRYKSEGNKIKADTIKSNLPAVTLSATFEGRRLTNAYAHYNNLLVIDIDKLNDEEMTRVEECLHKDPYVATYWKSPSGSGWKGLVFLQYSEETLNVDVSECHREAFIYTENYFRTNYQIELDISGKDITRLCFFSWDPDLVIKEEIVPISVVIEHNVDKTKNSKREEQNYSQIEVAKDYSWKQIEGRSTLKNNAMDRRLMENIYRYLQRHGLSITRTYNDWVKVAFAIANTFHPAYGRSIFMKLCELDGAGHNATKSEQLIYTAYTTMNNRSDFSTIIYLAREMGYVR